MKLNTVIGEKDHMFMTRKFNTKFSLILNQFLIQRNADENNNVS